MIKTMISMQATLQFEWAWQHPHKSRHLRDEDGKAIFNQHRSKQLKANIQYVVLILFSIGLQLSTTRLVYQMISTHPYNTWPLHVKLFTDEAVSAWSEAARDSKSLPPGFTCSIELEGVDGKAGRKGSGRQEPISVQDAISHMACLAQTFLNSNPNPVTVIPRGGSCPSCKSYVLWGDIVRGSYRRMAGSTNTKVVEEEEDEDEDLLDEASEDGLFISDSDALPSPKKMTAMSTSKRKPPQKSGHPLSSDEGELFDFGSVESVTMSDRPKRRGRPPKSGPSKRRQQTTNDDLFLYDSDEPVTTTAKAPKLPKPRQAAVMSSSSSDGDSFDFRSNKSHSMTERLRKRGRPPKNASADRESTPTLAPKPDQSPPIPRKRGRPRKIESGSNQLSDSRATGRTKNAKPRKQVHAALGSESDSNGEEFDFPSNSSLSLQAPSNLPSHSINSREGVEMKADSLVRAMTFMSLSSPKTTTDAQKPSYIEISD
ncbi:hypothetical protein H0H93_007929 [Arthromyces matolae]|nr:hypothetical protein H0H93_007929 [Arthromyces matolae]